MQKKSVNPGIQRKLTQREIQTMLIDNFVNLQRVLTNLTFKFDALSENIIKLLQLHELAAKSFLKKIENGTLGSEDKDIIRKLDTLLDQNKTVAKGLTLVEEKIRHKIYGDHLNPQAVYQKSISEASLGEKPKPLPKI
jgi:hypothetical protein